MSNSIQLKEIIGKIPSGDRFTNIFRHHQGWWRAFVLNEEVGTYYDNINKKWASVCNRINNGDHEPFKNFLTDEIAKIAMNSVEIQKEQKSGIIEKERLFNNLLSSQPLAFNFFGFLKTNPEVALAFVKTIRNEIFSVEEVVFEYAPKATKDHSAFDFGFVVLSPAGRGFIGFECKYTDAFSFKRKDSEVYYGDKSGESEDKNFMAYHQLYDKCRDRFNDDYFTYVRDKNFNQLFRNEILGVQLKDEYAFVITGLFCHHDDKETVNAGLRFQKKIGNEINDFLVVTYSDYFECIQKLDLTWKQREFIMLLWARYCGLQLSEMSTNPT